MARIKLTDSKNEMELNLVDKPTFETEISKLQKEIAEIRIRANPIAMREIKKLGKKSVSIKKLKGEMEKSPIEELMGG